MGAVLVLHSRTDDLYIVYVKAVLVLHSRTDVLKHGIILNEVKRYNREKNRKEGVFYTFTWLLFLIFGCLRK